MRILSKKMFNESILIFCFALVFGIITNFFHPHKVKISFSRPNLKFVEDDSSLENLSEISIISNSEYDEILEPVLFSKTTIKKLIQVDSALLIDSRSPEEYLKSHIPGAMCLPYNSIFEDKKLVNKLPKDKWLITYCDGPPCDVAESLAFELFYAGFKKVAVYPDGLEGWKKDNQGSNK